MSPDKTPLTSLAHGGGCGCKIAPDVLQDLLSHTPGPAPSSLLVDAATSDDAAVYKLTDDMALVATTDFFTPIVDDPHAFGRIAATNALSDIYAMGARPIFSLAILGMPVDKIAPETVRAILAGGREAAEAAGAPIAGGHSIDAAEPIYGLAALGLVHPDKLKTNAGAKAGDVLILGKPLGIGVFSAALKQGKLSGSAYEAMIASTTLLNRPGAELADMEGVHALTDVTGFGLLGHLSEMCRASHVAARLNLSDIPIFEAARALAADGVHTGASARNARALGGLARWPEGLDGAMKDLLTDPQTSGGLLVACAAESAGAVMDIFNRHGHGFAAQIGEISAGAPDIELV